MVGRNGRGYPPRWWPYSETFRQGTQANLLVGDNQTRNFNAMVWLEKIELSQATWGPYLQEKNLTMMSNGKRSGANEHRPGVGEETVNMTRES